MQMRVRHICHLDYFSGGTSNRVLLSAEFGAALDAVDGFFAGMADALTAGLSTRARAGMYGDSATKNHSGGFFEEGQITGTVLGMAIGAGSPCALGTGLKFGYRVLEGVQMVGGAINAGQNLAEGNYLAAFGDAVGVVGGIASFMKACFVASTPVVTKLGSRPIESFRSFEDYGEDCDWVLARDEHNDDAEPRLRRVLRTFERLSLVLWLTVDGQRIGTTSEHPFFVRGKGWTDAGELHVGQELRLLTPGWVKVEAVRATNDLVSVYNMEVEDDHTYFVGDVTWGWSVWAHNAYFGPKKTSELAPGGGLAAHEPAGGHTILRHIGKLANDLRARFLSSTSNALTAVSTFYNRRIAELAIARTIAAKGAEIGAWLAGIKPKLRLDYNTGHNVGRSVTSATSGSTHVQGVRVILTRDASSALGYRILTAFPQA